MRLIRSSASSNFFIRDFIIIKDTNKTLIDDKSKKFSFEQFSVILIIKYRISVSKVKLHKCLLRYKKHNKETRRMYTIRKCREIKKSRLALIEDKEKYSNLVMIR